MNNCNYLIFGVILVLFVILLWFSNKHAVKDLFIPVSKDCQIDSDCPDDQFCYMGKCWGYWKGVNMPWSSCRNPYCGNSDSNLECSANPGKCLPYCKCQTVRQPGGSINSNCYPKCGAPCLTNDDCPKGCPQCHKGTCSAPHPGCTVY